MSASLLRRRRTLVLEPESDVRRVDGGFVIEDLDGYGLFFGHLRI